MAVEVQEVRASVVVRVLSWLKKFFSSRLRSTGS